MGKFAPDTTLDVLPTKIATATRMSVCSAQPANFAGIAAVQLADVVMTPGDGNDYVIADGDVSGRKVTTVQKASVTVDVTGTGNHIVLDDGVDLIWVTTMVGEALTALQVITIPAWKVEVRDPT